MTAFWILVIGMTALALAFVLLPLLRRHSPAAPDAKAAELAVYRLRLAELKDDLARGILTEPQFDAAREELETAMATDLSPSPNSTPEAPVQRHWIMALVIIVAAPLLAFTLYGHLGAQRQMTAYFAAEQEAEARAQTMDRLLKQLEEKLAENPDQGEGWALLGRSYLKLGDAVKAAEALGKARALLGDEPELLLDYAQALAATQGERLQGAPAKLVEQALAKAPEHPRVLWMAAMAALEEGARDKARRYLEHLTTQLEPGSEEEQLVRAQLNELDDPVDSFPTREVYIEVQISLAPALQAKAQPTDTVFVFARAEEGPKMPLAVVRRQVKDLPLAVVLDDSLAMVPEMRLSKFRKVVIGARISPSGDPTPKSGDIEGLAPGIVETATLPQKPVGVVLDRVVP